jgi:DNA polymerase (family 10)
MDEVLSQAAANFVAVEVNGNPHRLDLKTEHVRMAVERGVALVASVDAHSTEELKYLRFAVGTARRGWVQPAQVLNTLSADDFVAELRKRRQRRAQQGTARASAL